MQRGRFLQIPGDPWRSKIFFFAFATLTLFRIFEFFPKSDGLSFFAVSREDPRRFEDSAVFIEPRVSALLEFLRMFPGSQVRFRSGVRVCRLPSAVPRFPPILSKDVSFTDFRQFFQLKIRFPGKIPTEVPKLSIVSIFSMPPAS